MSLKYSDLSEVRTVSIIRVIHRDFQDLISARGPRVLTESFRYFPLSLQASIGIVSSSVSIVSDYGLDDRGSIPGRGKGFFL
jgi:hypothetical protein